jgi:polysaccharide biosynthesis transport protein
VATRYFAPNPEAVVDLRDYVLVVRQHLVFITVTTLVGLLVAAGATALIPPTYQSQAQVFVSVQGQGTDQLLQVSDFSQQRVKSYVEAITSPLVLDPVIADLGLPMDASELGRNLQATVPLDTVLINLTASDDDAQRAADIVNAVTAQFVRTVPELEEPTGDAAFPVQVTVLRQGTAAEDPVSLSLPINLAMGLLGGLVIGLGLVLLRHATDSTIRTEKDLREITDAVVIGHISESKAAPQAPLETSSDFSSHRAESFRSLRTNLEFVNAARSVKSMVFVSSVPGEGRMTTVADAAVVLAESGARVCIVEADLRTPRLVDYLGLPHGAGLTDVLLGDVDYRAALRSYRGGRVAVIGAGRIPPNPSELLGSSAMGAVITRLEDDFDYVLLDAPPLLPVTDAAVLSRQVSGVVLLVGVGHVHQEQLRRTLTSLQNVESRVLGVVLNRLPRQSARTVPTRQGAYLPGPSRAESLA